MTTISTQAVRCPIMANKASFPPSWHQMTNPNKPIVEITKMRARIKLGDFSFNIISPQEYTINQPTDNHTQEPAG